MGAFDSDRYSPGSLANVHASWLGQSFLQIKEKLKTQFRKKEMHKP
jgi:hypothetical protein